MNGFRRLLTGSLLLVCLAASWGDAAPSVDQQQSTIDTTVGGLGINSGQWLAQVVTAGVSGELVEVRFPVACDSGELVVEIQGVTSDGPDGRVLASQAISASSLPHWPYPTPPELRGLAFTAPATVTTGNRYAIVLKSSSYCGVFQGPAGDSYEGGDAYYRDPTWPGWYLLSSGHHDLPFQTLVEMPPVRIDIDIKPGGMPNTINRGSNGRIPVAVLSSAEFDVAAVDPASLTFGPQGTEPSLVFCSSGLEDVNYDGLLDLVCHFDTSVAGFLSTDTVGVLRGVMFDGTPIRGSDSVRIRQ